MYSVPKNGFMSLLLWNMHCLIENLLVFQNVDFFIGWGAWFIIYSNDVAGQILFFFFFSFNDVLLLYLTEFFTVLRMMPYLYCHVSILCGLRRLLLCLNSSNLQPLGWGKWAPSSFQLSDGLLSQLEQLLFMITSWSSFFGWSVSLGLRRLWCWRGQEDGSMFIS